MKILKFGGSSVSSPERIKNVICIVKEKYDHSPKLAVVVSAFGGVTDELIQISQEASHGNKDYATRLTALHNRHRLAAEALIPTESLPRVLEQINQNFQELHDSIQGVLLVKELSKRTLDFIMSFGERLSAYIISEAMKTSIPNAEFLDARTIIKTDRNFGAALVDYEKTNALIQQWFTSSNAMPVITGFIASTEQNEVTTLGRGGSDFTAAIVGAGLNVDEIEIWTDVNGVMTADPRKVQQAFPIPKMTFKEALEMSYFGAKVIHPPTITPALHKNIPIWIKNTFNPTAEGTFISHRQNGNPSSAICGLSSIDKVSLLRLEGSGMVGAWGIAMRLFGALAKKEISVILISQGSSEHSICFAIAPRSAKLAVEAINEEFKLEMHAELIDPVIVENDLSIVAVVGENMRKTPGIAGRVFGSLGKNGINVVAMVQGSSEYNISIVVKSHDEVKALNVIHEEFFLSRIATLNLFLVGTGLIGKTLLEQIQKQFAVLREEHALEIRVAGLANSQNMCFNPTGISLDNWEKQLQESAEKMEISSFVAKMKELNLMNSVFVDCTASEEIAKTYATILESSISIVTPNKKANSGPYFVYQQLKYLSKQKGIKFYYETNVGAGLPVISTVADLLKSGDKILKIEAVLSGTLSYLFNSFTKGKKFSEVLQEAQQKGFTEPDPREDLNGKDVMRKILILARESGHALEMAEIVIEPLLPEECFSASSVADFYQKLKEFDKLFDQKREQAEKEGKVLRYGAEFENGVAKISLKAVDSQHPFFHLSGSDNIISITTERYRETPLVIKGQGAGAQVTAGEVLADIIRIAQY